MSASAQPLSQFKSFCESFAARRLDGYRTTIESRHLPRSQKLINDALWGTIRLDPAEVLVLDTPLLQRLRYVKQLGVVHWVYPGAGHSRLEHSLGAVHQLQNLVESVNAETELISTDERRLLRLAALCHDIGHALMSHVSQNVMNTMDFGIRIRLAFADEHGSEEPPISEIAAYYMVLSPSFRALTKTIYERLGERPLPPEGPEFIANAIVGLPISNKFPILHELINGPFDADKLDWMPRDAHLAKVPVVTDIPRLIEKVRAIALTEPELPESIAKLVDQGEKTYTIMGIDLSGGRTLDELMLGRSLLFDKIYRHQKVRTAEAMVWAAVRILVQLLPGDPPEFLYSLSDDELLHLNIDSITRLHSGPLSQDEIALANVALDLLTRLRERDLFVRCFAFCENMPLDPYQKDPDQRSGLYLLQRHAADRVKQSALVSKIAATVREIVQYLSAEGRLTGYLTSHLESYIAISAPEPPEVDSDTPRAFLIADERLPLRFRDDAAETRGWADAYVMTRDMGYVFAPEPISPFVFLATEFIVRNDFEVRIPQSMVRYAKQETRTVDELRAKLAGAGFYASSPYDLRPLPGRLRRADINRRLDDITRKFVGYEGPALD